jgi:hypothetical protein
MKTNLTLPRFFLLLFVRRRGAQKGAQQKSQTKGTATSKFKQTNKERDRDKRNPSTSVTQNPEQQGAN